MKDSSLAALKRYVETFGSVSGAAAETGIPSRTIAAFVRSREGAELVSSWTAVYRLRTWRTRPDLVNKALAAVETGLDGFEETHTKQKLEVERNDRGEIVYNEQTGQPRTRAVGVEVRRVRKAPDIRLVSMILGGTPEIPRNGEADAPPVIQISDELDDSI